MNYKVFAELKLKSSGALGSTNRITSAVERLRNRLQGAQSSGSNLTRNLIGMAAGVVGIHAISRATRSLIGSSIEYNASLERTKIGLAAVVSQVEGTSFAQGMQQAAGVFDHLRDASITSTATAGEMLNIFQQIVGPMRAAGSSMADIEGITASTVAASSALGVDFEQAARDIQMMTRGVAGTDVKLFSLLRSTGAIAESTEEWNNSLTAPERIERLTRALGQFDASSDAAGRSWMGVTSTFRGLTDEMKRAFAGPIIEQIQRFLGRINSLFIENRRGMFGSLAEAGEAAAVQVGRALDWAFTKVEYIVDHWDEIIGKIREVASYIQSITPTIIKFAKAAALMAAAKGVAGTGMAVAGAGLGVVNAGAGLAGAAGAAGGAVRGAAAGAAGLGARLARAGGGLASMLGIGALTTQSLMAASATTTAATAIGGVGTAMGAAGASAIGLGGGFSVLGSIMAFLTSPITLVVAGVMAIIGVFVALANKTQAIGEMWNSTAGPALTSLWESLKRLYKAIEPLLEVMGSAVMGVLVKIIEALATALGVVIDVISSVIEAISDLISRLKDLITTAEPATGILKATREEQTANALLDGNPMNSPLSDQALAELQGESFVPESLRRGEAQPASQRNININRMNVNQEFRQADPDRILQRVTEDLERAAEQRVGSGFAPALSG